MTGFTSEHFNTKEWDASAIRNSQKIDRKH